MIVTEQEAKTKRCQESFGDGNLGSGFAEPRPAFSFGGAGFVTTAAATTSPMYCIGSACMAWRWHAWATYKHRDDDGRSFDMEVRLSETHGFCGKAGIPKGYEAS